MEPSQKRDATQAEIQDILQKRREMLDRVRADLVTVGRLQNELSGKLASPTPQDIKGGTKPAGFPEALQWQQVRFISFDELSVTILFRGQETPTVYRFSSKAEQESVLNRWFSPPPKP